MKMSPITFKEEYNNQSYGNNVNPGFEPFEDELGVHNSRIVEIQLDYWDRGVCFIVAIYDNVRQKNTLNVQQKKILNDDIWIYDHCPFFGAEDIYIIPSNEQAMLMRALVEGDIRGKTAEMMIRELYIDMCIMNPKFKMEKYLPEVKDFWVKHYNENGLQVKSK